jgi:hypothetical protein
MADQLPFPRKVRVVVATISPAAEAAVLLPAALVDRVLDTLAGPMKASDAGREVTDNDVLAATLLSGLVGLTRDSRTPHHMLAASAAVSYLLIYPRRRP